VHDRYVPEKQDMMSAKHREVAESFFDKSKRREAEINIALQQANRKARSSNEKYAASAIAPVAARRG
jgi:hypothetical protein